MKKYFLVKILSIVLLCCLMSSTLVFAKYNIEEVQIGVYSDGIGNFSQGLATIDRYAGEVGYINIKGEEVIPCIYGEANEFKDGVARVVIFDKNATSEYNWRKYGFINIKGEIVVECIYSYAYDFSNGLAWLEKEGYFGAINTKGEEVIPFVYEMGFDFNNDFAIVRKESKYGIINKEGEEIVPCIYSDPYAFDIYEEVIIIKRDNKYGYLDKKGNEIIPCQFEYAGEFSEEGLARVRKNEKMGYINKKGKLIIPYTYDNGYTFREGLARILKNEKYGYINSSGEEVIPCIYDDASDFSNDGISLVKKNGKYGYINTKGEQIIPCIYNNIFEFRNGLASFEKDKKYGVMNIKGEEIVPCIYEYIGYYSEGLCMAIKDGKVGYLDKKGIEKIPFIYEKEIYLDDKQFLDGLAIVKKEGKYGLIDKNGQEIISCIYDTLSIENKYNVCIAKRNGASYLIKLNETQEGRKTPSKVYINGQEVEFEAYNVEGNNYFKLRDLAYALKNTEKQFEVAWNEEYNRIDLISNKSYSKVGNELENLNINGENKIGTRTTSSIYLDNNEIELKAYNIDGYNYFKLRDLLEKIDCEVMYDEVTRNININTAREYVVE